MGSKSSNMENKMVSDDDLKTDNEMEPSSPKLK
jgi:hypothetical protein